MYAIYIRNVQGYILLNAHYIKRSLLHGHQQDAQELYGYFMDQFLSLSFTRKVRNITITNNTNRTLDHAITKGKE